MMADGPLGRNPAADRTLHLRQTAEDPMKRRYLATSLLSLGLAACGYKNEGYNNETAYNNAAAYNESGNYSAEGNYGAGNNYSTENLGNIENAAVENRAQTTNEANSVTNNGY
jgi:hypothetical protein